jgi:hypothetical protein
MVSDGLKLPYRSNTFVRDDDPDNISELTFVATSIYLGLRNIDRCDSPHGEREAKIQSAKGKVFDRITILLVFNL